MMQRLVIKFYVKGPNDCVKKRSFVLKEAFLIKMKHLLETRKTPLGNTGKRGAMRARHADRLK